MQQTKQARIIFKFIFLINIIGLGNRDIETCGTRAIF